MQANGERERNANDAHITMPSVNQVHKLPKRVTAAETDLSLSFFASTSLSYTQDWTLEYFEIEPNQR